MPEDTDLMFKEIIKRILDEKPKNSKELNKLKIEFAIKYTYNDIIKNAQIIAYSSNKDRDKIIKILNIKPVRELSGVTVVALFAKPHACPHGKCMYCPGGPGSPFGDTPQSYTGKEPAAMRAIRNNYDPYLQIFNRLEHYVVNGHRPDKLELIFMGGTFPSLDKEYRDEFVTFTYKAINDFAKEFVIEDSKGKKQIDYDKFNEFFETKEDFSSEERKERIFERTLKLKALNPKSLQEEITQNETSLIRSIGLTIETKPDWAFEKHCNEMLEYGCTRFEVGVQTLEEECLKKTHRGHTLEDTRKSFGVMKDMCFKINAHMMLGLPASTLEKDENSLINLFKEPYYRPDMIKFYPCLVVKGTPLYSMWKAGKFKPIDTKEAARIIAKVHKDIPRYVRVMRVQRDIPTTVVNEGVQNSNLRQYVEKEMEVQKIESSDIRAREIGFRQLQGIKQKGEFGIKIEKFEASGGVDYFLDVVDELDTMIGFIRLRFPKNTNLRPEINEKTALIRELHIYGQTLAVGDDSHALKVQHKGWGRKLLEKAESIAKEEGYEKMVIISGVGVREYYRKFGYVLEGPYMVKEL